MPDAADLDLALSQLVIVPSTRGMAELARELRPDLFTAAAAALLENHLPIVLATGFPIGGRPETDGPPGAFALADALVHLGHEVAIACWHEANLSLSAIRPDLEYIDVPVTAAAHPAPLGSVALIAIEACGRTLDGTYRNMRHQDISAAAPRFEDCFGEVALVAIGDGGNEFGLGGFSDEFYANHNLIAPVSTAEHVLPGVTSNYAAYALVCALERASGQSLLPDPDDHCRLIERLVAAGFVDGMSGQNIPLVDGMELIDTKHLLSILRPY